MLSILKEQITTPFLQFLETLIEHGANPRVAVQKLAKYRDFDEKPGLSQSVSAGTAAPVGRRPPEKDQYDGAFGLCNALHIVLDFPTKPLFNFLLDLNIDMHQ